MQMKPFFPPLRPQSLNRWWLEVTYINEEAQATRYELEHQTWRDSIKNAGAELQPLGKILTLPGIETDDEDANDDSEDSDSHDDEDEETNERVISGAPQDYYSMVEEGGYNDDPASLPVG